MEKFKLVLYMLLIWGSYLLGWLIVYITKDSGALFTMVIITITMFPFMATGMALDNFEKNKKNKKKI